MHAIKFLPLALLAFAACSNDNPSGNDAGSDAQTQDAPANGIHQTGTIVDFSSKNPLSGVTVSGGGGAATTGADGKYTLTVAKDSPYTMTVANDGYLTLHEQEWQLSADSDRGQTLAVANGIENLLKSALTGLDPTLGVLSVDVIATGSCASPVGATISVPGLPQPSDGGASDGGATDAGSGGPKLVYFAGGFPTSANSVQDTSTPSAVIYNLPVGKFSQITVSHPSCTMVSFPTPDPNIATMTYTGNVQLDPSGPTDDAGVTQNVASFIRVFLK